MGPALQRHAFSIAKLLFLLEIGEKSVSDFFLKFRKYQKASTFKFGTDRKLWMNRQWMNQ